MGRLIVCLGVALTGAVAIGSVGCTDCVDRLNCGPQTLGPGGATSQGGNGGATGGSEMGGGGDGGGGGAPAVAALDVVAGGRHSCAIMSDRTVRCWGSNDRGQVGSGSTSDFESMPVDVGLADVTAIGAAFEHTCAIASGEARCWGANSFGELGMTTETPFEASPQATGLMGTSVALTRASTCLQTSSGVECWGLQLNGTADIWLTPASKFATSVDRIDAGGGSHCAKTATSTMCWGANGVDQISSSAPNWIITPVAAHFGATRVGLGPELICGVSPARTVNCLGELAGMGEGQLANVSDVKLGSTHACALLVDGTTWCWGRNDDNELGNPMAPNAETPVQVQNISNGERISVGDSHSCAVTSNGTVWCWGRNTDAELGDGTVSARTTPVQVQFE